MKKSVTISELRFLVRTVLKEVMVEAPTQKKRTDTFPIPGDFSSADTERPVGWSGEASPGERNVDFMMKRQDANTIPASSSNAERAVDQEFREKNRTVSGGVHGEKVPVSAGPANQKSAMITRILASKGVVVDQNILNQWVNILNPGDVLVKTAEQLATEFLSFQQGAA